MPKLPESLLKPYQHRAVDFGERLADKGGGYFVLDTGLGKTVTTLTLALKLLQKGKARRVLVVAPPRVADEVWRQEAEAWDHLASLEVVPLVGSPKKRMELLAKEADIHVISYSLLGWLLANSRLPYDTLILDEASAAKNPSSKRFKMLKKLRKQAERVYLLSATPSADSLMSLWSQYYLIDEGARLGKYFSHFRERFFQSRDFNKFYWEARQGSLFAIRRLIKDCTLRLSKEEYLDLPALLHNTIKVKVPVSAMKIYKELEKEFYLVVNGKDIVADSAAILSGKLRQCANGFLYDPEGESHQIHTAKLDALDELVESTLDEPVLLFYEFKSDWARIKERFPHASHIKDSNIVDDWNDKDKPVKLLCGHYQSMAHGLNLQKGGACNMVFFTPTWSNECHQQAIGRLYRTGQEKKVTCHYLVAAGTVDEKVVRALVNKQNVQDTLLAGI